MQDFRMLHIPLFLSPSSLVPFRRPRPLSGPRARHGLEALTRRCRRRRGESSLAASGLIFVFILKGEKLLRRVKGLHASKHGPPRQGVAIPGVAAYLLDPHLGHQETEERLAGEVDGIEPCRAMLD